MSKWKPGQSGNPAGRPPKHRALTTILEKAGNKTIAVEGQDRRVARKRLVAELVWQLVSEGKAVMPDGTELTLDPRDWVNTVKWIYAHIDGAAKGELDITSDGEKIFAVSILEQTDLTNDDG